MRICRVYNVNVTGLLLDVGAGSGNVSRHFLPHFSEVVLLDMSKVKLKKAKSALPNTFCVCADAHNLPFKDNSFNQLHAFSLIEHLSCPRSFLQETSRVLRVNGLLILQFPNPKFFLELHTGIMLPRLLPRVVKDRIVREAFPGLYVNWDTTANVLTHVLNKLFVTVSLDGFSYPEETVNKLVRPLFQVARKLRFLDIVPMGYVILASRGGLD